MSIPIRRVKPNPTRILIRYFSRKSILIRYFLKESILIRYFWGHYIRCIYQVHALFLAIYFTCFSRKKTKWRIFHNDENYYRLLLREASTFIYNLVLPKMWIIYKRNRFRRFDCWFDLRRIVALFEYSCVDQRDVY